MQVGRQVFDLHREAATATGAVEDRDREVLLHRPTANTMSHRPFLSSFAPSRRAFEARQQQAGGSPLAASLMFFSRLGR